MSGDSQIMSSGRSAPVVALTVTGSDVVDQVVSELNELQNRATLNLALRMGELIIRRFYGGDLASWRRHKAKEASFRRLALRCRSDLRVSPTSLYRAVALYELTTRLGESAVRGLT